MVIDYKPPPLNLYDRPADPAGSPALAPGGLAPGAGGAAAVDQPDAATAPLHIPLPPLAPPELGQGTFGGSAVDGPVLPPLSSMSNLSAADMIQIIRKEIKQIAEGLQQAQAQAIKSSQDTIEAKSKATIEKLNEAIGKLEEAQKIKDAMGIFNKVMYGVMGVMLALFTPMMACLPPLAVLAWGAYAAYITVNEKDNGKIMEDCMTKISEGFGVAWADEGKEKQRENGMIAFTSTMATVQILIAIVTIIASVGTAAPAAASTAATTTATSVALAASEAATTAATSAATTAASTATAAATTAASTAASTATTAATTAASTASSAAATVASTASQVAGAAQKIAGVVQIGVTIGTSSAKIAAGACDYQGTMMKADAEDTKAQIKMMQNLLKSEMDFLQQLVSVQAELDKGVAAILRDEHQTNQQLQQVTQFS